jgi:uncharacterized protein YbjT (DUF2867 family)
MDAKFAGEKALRASGVPFTIVRPGGLRSGGTEAKAVVIGQGDVDIPNGDRAVDRSDVARLIVDAIALGPRNVTLETVSALDAGGAGAVLGTDRIQVSCCWL